jgi:hypothetical protein
MLQMSDSTTMRGVAHSVRFPKVVAVVGDCRRSLDLAHSRRPAQVIRNVMSGGFAWARSTAWGAGSPKADGAALACRTCNRILEPGRCPPYLALAARTPALRDAAAMQGDRRQGGNVGAASFAETARLNGGSRVRPNWKGCRRARHSHRCPNCKRHLQCLITSSRLGFNAAHRRSSSLRQHRAIPGLIAARLFSVMAGYLRTRCGSGSPLFVSAGNRG